MNKRDIKILEQFKKLVSKKAKVYEMRIFGSRRRGNAAEFSDMDVFVVLEHLDHSLERYISDCAWEVGFPEDVIIMPVVVSLDSLKNSPLRESVFIKNVYREGVII